MTKKSRTHNASYKRQASRDVFSPARIVSAMTAAGAEFYFSTGHTLRVRGLGKIPHELRELFLNHDEPAAIVAAVREAAR